MCYKKLVTHVESRVSAVSPLESGEQHQIKVINNSLLSSGQKTSVEGILSIASKKQFKHKQNGGGARGAEDQEKMKNKQFCLLNALDLNAHFIPFSFTCVIECRKTRNS